MTIRSFRGAVPIGVAALALFLLFPLHATPEDHSAAAPGPVPFQPGITLKNQETGEERPVTMLGGEVGVLPVKGVLLRLYVLQADSAKRWATPGATTHIFTAALTEEKGGKVVPGAQVTLSAEGGGTGVKATLKEYKEKFYQGRVRLAEEGHYVVEVRFKAGKRNGSAKFGFDVKPPAGVDSAAPAGPAGK